MLRYGYTGIWEILIIAILIFWLLNAYRKNTILRKMEDQINKKNTPQPNSKQNINTYSDVEDVEYEEVK